MKNLKKNFYKKWWFWVIVVIVFVRVMAFIQGDKPKSEQNVPNQNVQEQKQEQPKETKKNAKSERALLEEKVDKTDFDKVIEEEYKELRNEENFPYLQDVYIGVKKDKKEIIFSAIVDYSTSNDTALELADTMIRRFSALAQMNNGELKGPGHEYYGEVFDVYNISMIVGAPDSVDNKDSVYINQYIVTGRFKKIKLKK